MYSVVSLTHILVSQAFKRTMAMSQGDIDEAVIFAKVTKNLAGVFFLNHDGINNSYCMK